MAFNAMFLNNPLTINQNTNIYSYYPNEGSYDYIFSINLDSFAPDITTIFNNASFIQNSDNIENYDINIVLDKSNLFNNWNNVFMNQNLITVDMGLSNIAFSTLNPAIQERFGDRLLEVVAHKIFGHGQSHAAINNDYEFYTHDGELWNHFSNTVAMSNMRNDIFNQYIALGRYGDMANNDKYNWVNFNFKDLTFDFPMYLVGNLLTDPTLTNDERNMLNNGPNVGGSSLVNGEYNVPILIHFYSSAAI